MGMETPSGAIGLLVGAVGYALGLCTLAGPREMALPTPCADWDLGTLLGHLGDSMADLETALRTGCLDPDPGRLPRPEAGDPVEALRDRAADLLCSAYGYSGPGRFVIVGGLPMPAGLVACTGSIEIAVHGWDVSAALGDGRPIPDRLASQMFRLCPLLVAGREGLFAAPVAVPAQASPGDRLIGYLGRQPRNTLAGPGVVTSE